MIRPHRFADVPLRTIAEAAADAESPSAVPPAPTFGKPVAADDPETAFWTEVKANGAREYYEAYAKQ
jgi:hypothetical protein